MTTPTDAAAEIVRLWLEGPQDCFTRPVGPGLAAAAADNQPLVLVGKHDAHPRLAVAIVQEQETPDFQAIAGAFGPAPYTRLAVVATLEGQPLEPQPDHLVVSLYDILAELQEWSLDHPHHRFARSLGQLWALLLHQAGYRSPRFPVARRVWHVVPHQGQWALKARGVTEPESVHPTKEAAVAAGVERARAFELSQLLIHRADGSFEEERTYGRDPRGEG